MNDETKTFNKYEEISCPHCGENQGIDSENLSGLVTYWGEDGAEKMECVDCEKDFYIKEEVSRHWDIAKLEEDLF